MISTAAMERTRREKAVGVIHEWHDRQFEWPIQPIDVEYLLKLRNLANEPGLSALVERL